MKASFLVAADHALAMVVSAIVGQRPYVPTACVKPRPADKTEVLDAVDVRQQSSRLLSVGVRELALVAGHCCKGSVAEHAAQFR